MNLTVILLAAGLGTRMKSKKAKVLHRAGGRTLVAHVVRAALGVAAAENIVVVTGHQAEAVEDELRPFGVRFVRQLQQKGTGHAVECTRELLESGEGLVMVLYGDTPLLSTRTLRLLVETHRKSQASATLISTTLENPHGYGRIVRDEDGLVSQIVEHKVATPEQLLIAEINSGIYCFQAELLWRHLGEVRPDNPAREFYLTDMAAILRRRGFSVAPLHVADSRELLGINTRVELADVDRILRDRKNSELMLAGVTIERPETVVIDPDVRIGMDTVVEPFARILGESVIGEDCRVGAGATVENSILADRSVVEPLSIVANTRIDSGAKVGPFARLRMDTHIGADARIGNFVELKKTEFGAGAKSQHLAYLGDSEIGSGANIGAGTITCNFDGFAKHKTQIGEGAFIGSNATLVAPVTIGDQGYVGAGSTITDEVPPGALALGRGRQVNKEGWVARRKQKDPR